MSLTLTEEQSDVVEKMRTSLVDVENVGRYTLTDAMRLAAEDTEQSHGWGTGIRACAFHATGLHAVATGYIPVDN